MIADADLDGDGHIDFQEFSRLMKSHQKLLVKRQTSPASVVNFPMKLSWSFRKHFGKK